MNKNLFLRCITSSSHAWAFILTMACGLFTFAHQVAASEIVEPKNATAIKTSKSTEKILVSISNDTVSWTDDTLYTLNPSDGSGQTKLFDFHNQPKITTGELFAPRISSGGQYIYFHSEHAFNYTPARRNAFRIASNGGNLDQITPGPESGIWGETGNSTVSGWVRKGNGDPWGSAAVYLEGMDSVNSNPDGSFSIQNVPPGVRWLMAYRPDFSAFDSLSIQVVTNLNNTNITLTPDGTWRSNFEFPVFYNDRVYYQTNSAIQWTDINYSSQQTVYTPSSDGCVTLARVKAFDVAPSSGKLAVFDHHGDGCTNNVGLYITDKDGGNKQTLANMWSDTNWSVTLLPVEIFWSADESRIAFKGVYAFYQVIVVIDASTGIILGNAFAATASEILTLHGWNPTGDGLLYSTYDGDITQKTLSKIIVIANGNIGDGTGSLASAVNLLTRQPISGATWGALTDASYTVTPSAGANGTVSPNTAQSVAHGATVQFSVTANNGFSRDSSVGGTCTAGGWNGDTYTTGAITADCSVSFSFSQQGGAYTVSATASAGGSVTPTSSIVNAGDFPSFIVTADGNHTRSDIVGGTCPTGSWIGDTYTTGAIVSTCSVNFSFNHNTECVVSGGIMLITKEFIFGSEVIGCQAVVPISVGPNVTALSGSVFTVSSTTSVSLNAEVSINQGANFSARIIK